MRLLNFKSRFLLRNLFKGFFALAIIVVLYILLQKYTPFEGFIDYVGNWPYAVYLVFIISEVALGIIPPELFMIWSIKHGLFDSYFLNILLLAMISFGAGVLGYFVGSYAKNNVWLKPVFQKYIFRYRNTLNRFGGLLLLVGAITPVPFSAICMLVGSTNYNLTRFLLIASSRFLRFAAYSAIIFQANI